MSHPFPDDIRNPDRQGPNPFADAVDEDGEIVDAVEATADASEESQPYAATPQPPVYRPVYDAVYRPRSMLVFALGMVGAGFVALGGLGMVFINLSLLFARGALFSNMAPFAVFGVVLSVCAWVMGVKDLRGITTGAVQEEGVLLLQSGLYLGVFGTIVGLLGLAGYLVYILLP